MSYTLFFDGACPGNPGPCGAGFVIFDKDQKIIYEGSVFLGHNTNNFSEYSSLKLGLKKLIELNLCDFSISVFGDSNLVIKQTNEEWSVKSDNLKNLNKEVLTLKKMFKNITFSHVYRDKNSHADRLANKALVSFINKKL